MTKPISPDEVQDAKDNLIPPEVIKIFNNLIIQNWDGMEAIVKKNTALSEISSTLDIEQHEVYARKLLDVESIFRKEGWSVEYKKPSYDENFDAFYRFTKKK